RAKGMGIVGAAFGLGFILGPALAGLLSHGANVQLTVGLAAASFSFLDLLLAAAVLKESLTPELKASAGDRGRRLERMAAALRHPIIGLPVVLFFIVTVAWSQLEPTAARLAQERFHFSAPQTGYMFAYLGLVVALIQGGFVGRIVKRTGEAPLLLVGTVLLGLGLALVPFASGTGGLYGVLTLLGAGQALTVPSLYSLVSRATAADQQGGTLGVTQGFSSLARAVGPALGGWLFGLRFAFPFWFGAALMAAAFLLATRVAAAASPHRPDLGVQSAGR
ncbi:MAG TPA: MFS transporter, partial [Armatimonadota bacterium]|nr:MFS transporter [Armatimonadota bacterium]